MNPASPSQSAVTGNLPTTHRPFYLAPLRGVTDVIYRRTYAEHFGGIDLAVAPFVTTHAGRRIKPAHVRDLQPEERRKQ
jgi:tRNA-dihydrouridine synthase